MTHKAGKQLMKDVPNFYQANPEEEQVQLERVQKLIKEGGEINILDAK